MKATNYNRIVIGFLILFCGLVNINKVSGTESSTTLKTAATQIIEEIALNDTYIDSGDPTANFGGQDWLYAGKDFLDNLHESYFYFDFSKKPSNWISAIISLDIWSVPQTMNLDVYLITERWGELTMNWMNKPAKNGNLTTLQLVNDDRYNFDVSTNITGRTNISICVTYNIMIDDYVIMYSSEEGLGYSWYGEDNPKILWVCPAAPADDDDNDDDDNNDSIFKSILGYNVLLIFSLISIITLILIKKFKGKTVRI